MYRFLKNLLHFELKGRGVMIVFSLICVVAGGLLGFYFLPQDWTSLRRIFAGMLGGAGSALIIVTSRMVGAYHETKD
jgi:hypothetical protein